jgi:hypothetical protein
LQKYKKLVEYYDQRKRIFQTKFREIIKKLNNSKDVGEMFERVTQTADSAAMDSTMMRIIQFYTLKSINERFEHHYAREKAA